MAKQMISIPRGKIFSPHIGHIVFKRSGNYSAIMEIHDDKSGDPLEVHYWFGEQYDGNCARMKARSNQATSHNKPMRKRSKSKRKRTASA